MLKFPMTEQFKMEDFANGWCAHHFTFLDTNNTGELSNNATQLPYPSPPWWPSTSNSSYPHQEPDPHFHTSGHPPDHSASSDDDAGSVRSADNSLSDVGPVEETPPDREARAGYLRLLLVTESHRRELQRRRRAERAPPPVHLSADTERLRQRQMQQLYGAAAERVAAAETRAQLEFDTLTDRHRPPLWPNIPLRIRFE